jgi:AbiV family abortive infection protein
MAVKNNNKTIPLNKAINACLDNARRLLDDAEFLGVSLGIKESAPTSYALCVLAQEEYAKAFILYLVDHGCVPWNADVRKMLTNHTCKHLVTLVLDFLNPPYEIFHKSVEDFLKGVRDDKTPYLPYYVVDAINIIRREKADKWSSRNDWIDPGDRPCDPVARKIGDGVLDKRKQDALYVRVGRTGNVISTPSKIDSRLAKSEYEKAERFAQVISRRGDKLSEPVGLDFEKTSATFKVIFGLMPFEDFKKHWWL